MFEIKPTETNFYKEAGEIHTIAKKLEAFGIELIFDQNGIRASEIHNDPVHIEYFLTARELKAYYWGLQDGSATRIKEEKDAN